MQSFVSEPLIPAAGALVEFARISEGEDETLPEESDDDRELAAYFGLDEAQSQEAPTD